MKKRTYLIVSILCLATLSFGINTNKSYASSNKIKVTLKKKNITANEDGKAKISGKTDKNVKIEINNKKVRVKSNGKFSYVYTLKSSDTKKKIKVVATLKGAKTNKQYITITRDETTTTSTIASSDVIASTKESGTKAK